MASQAQAIEQWIAGSDPSGPGFSGLKLPTLVADGAIDQLDPVANDHLLAAAVPSAELAIYPDAGHAFLFQDEAIFVPRVLQFLS